MYGCVRALSQRDISRTSRPTTWFNSHAFLLCSLSLFLSSSFPSIPTFFFLLLPPLSPFPFTFLHLYLARLHRRSCPFFLGVEGQTRTSEIRTKPWPTEGESSAGSLAILTSPRSPNTRMLDCSRLLLLLVTSLK